MTTSNPPFSDERPNSEILKDILRAPFTIVWLVLIGATLTSWYFGTGHGIDNHAAITTLVMVVAFIKMRFVGLYFMELRDAPIQLRSLFEGYCIIVCSIILGIYYAS